VSDVKKYCRAGKVTDDMAHEYCMLDNQGYRQTDRHTHTHSYTNAPQCYVIRTLPICLKLSEISLAKTEIVWGWCQLSQLRWRQVKDFFSKLDSCGSRKASSVCIEKHVAANINNTLIAGFSKRKLTNLDYVYAVRLWWRGRI
jgi:hypothetical protein